MSKDENTELLLGLGLTLNQATTRLFDTQITQATKKIVELMANHRAVRDFIMKHF